MSIIVIVKSPPASVTVVAQWAVPSFTIFAGGSVDLAGTIPAGVPTNGKWTVDSSGQGLPTGTALTAAGMFTALPTTPLGVFAGIVFSYTLPAV